MVRARHKLLLASAVILCSLGEQLLVQATWVHYADKPESAGLYREPEWLPRLKQQVGDGSVLCYTSHRDKDYFHDNHLSSFGIKQAEGYETVRPKRLHALQDILTHPEAAAKAGISHLLVNPRQQLPETKGWNLVENTSRYVLFANPHYRGRYFANGPATEESAVVHPNWLTYNKMDFTVPPGAFLTGYSGKLFRRLDGTHQRRGARSRGMLGKLRHHRSPSRFRHARACPPPIQGPPPEHLLLHHPRHPSPDLVPPVSGGM